MSRPADAPFLLRLLLGVETDAGTIAAADWEPLVRLAHGNAVLLRTAERLAQAGVVLPAGVAARVTAERERVTAALLLVGALGRACTTEGVAHLFPKALQHYPDLGSDIDLLVLETPARFRLVLTATLGGAPERRGFADLVAGTEQYRVPGCPVLLDVQYGRLGVAGEHCDFAAQLVAHRRLAPFGGAWHIVPDPQDQLVLQAIQRVLGRRTLRLADVVWTINAVRAGLDWTAVLTTVRPLGLAPALGCYLSYVARVWHELTGATLLPPRLAAELPLEGWGRVEFRAGRYQLPTLQANGRLYVRTAVALASAGNWGGAGRLGALPALALAAAGRKLWRWRAPTP